MKLSRETIGSLLIYLVVIGSPFASAWLDRSNEHGSYLEAALRKVALGNSIVVNRSGIVVESTEGAEKMFGYTKDELKGMRAEQLMAERYRAGHREKIAIRLSPPIDYEATVTVPRCGGLKKSGEEFPVEIRTRAAEIDGEPYAYARFTELSKLKVVQSE